MDTTRPLGLRSICDSLMIRKSTFSTGRIRKVLDMAVAKSGWERPLAESSDRSGARPVGRRGRGVAAHMMFGAYVAHVAEVTVGDDGGVRVDRVVCAVDCGVVVNPIGARAHLRWVWRAAAGCTE